MKIGRRMLASCFVYLFGVASVFAAGPIDHFQVSFYPTSAQTGEALDLIIKAVDKDGLVVTNYQEMVLIYSESDSNAELPIVLDDLTYTFTAADQGEIIFENALKFSTEGKQDIYVYDIFQETVYGMGEINITKASTNVETPINLLSPENGITIGQNKVSVSGTSEKNHQIEIIINGTDSVLTMTNDAGVFEREISNLTSGQNSFVAKILDADNNTIGTSQEVKITVQENDISLISLKTVPEEVNSEEAYEIEVIATPGLTSVNAIVNDVLISLTEGESGKYITRTHAPKEAGTYKIDVTLKDELGHEIKEIGAGSIKVNEAQEIVIIIDEPDELPEPIIDLPAPDVEPPITTPTPPIKEEPKELKITGLKLVQLKTKSILTWDKLKDAKSYNVYKKLENGSLELITNVKEPTFEVLIDMDAEEVKYEYFAVKAVGETSGGVQYEGSLSEVTKIQTGPEIFILLLLSLLIGGLFLGFSKKKKA